MSPLSCFCCRRRKQRQTWLADWGQSALIPRPWWWRTYLNLNGAYLHTALLAIFGQVGGGCLSTVRHRRIIPVPSALHMEADAAMSLSAAGFRRVGSAGLDGELGSG